jgi:hypothetical protein
MKELEASKLEMEAFRAELEGKEKEVRKQVVQVKQLRRSLKEMALGGIHFSTPSLANGPPLHSKDCSSINGPALGGEEKAGTRQAVVHPILARLLLKVDVNGNKKKIANGLTMKEKDGGSKKEDKLRHVLEVELDFCRNLADATAQINANSRSRQQPEKLSDGSNPLVLPPETNISTSTADVAQSGLTEQTSVSGETFPSGKDEHTNEVIEEPPPQEENMPTATAASVPIEERRQPTPPAHGKRSRPNSKSNPRPTALVPAPAPAPAPLPKEVGPELTSVSAPAPESQATSTAPTATVTADPKHGVSPPVSNPVSAPDPVVVPAPAPELQAAPSPAPAPAPESLPVSIPSPAPETIAVTVPVPAPAPKGNAFSMGYGKKKKKKNYFAKTEDVAPAPAPAPVSIATDKIDQPEQLGSTYNNDNVDLSSFNVPKEVSKVPQPSPPPAEEAVDEVVDDVVDDEDILDIETLEEVKDTPAPAPAPVPVPASTAEVVDDDDDDGFFANLQEVKEQSTTQVYSLNLLSSCYYCHLAPPCVYFVLRLVFSFLWHAQSTCHGHYLLSSRARCIPKNIPTQKKNPAAAVIVSDAIPDVVDDDDDMLDIDTLEEVKDYNQPSKLGINNTNSISGYGSGSSVPRAKRGTTINAKSPQKQQEAVSNDISFFGGGGGSMLDKTPTPAPAPAPAPVPASAVEDDDENDGNYDDDDFFEDSLDAEQIE